MNSFSFSILFSPSRLYTLHVDETYLGEAK